ncbi:hypothetical protein OPQ81_005395 [Rhizoctonia solani]|nr:hypothetical protein OPQ81_005395 [Rhizoctonia solani]
MFRKGTVKGMDIQTRAPFHSSQSQASKVLKLLHSDLHGPVAVEAIGGIKYFAVTINDKSCKIFVHLLKSKDKYPARFKELRASMENLTGKTIKHLHTDGGGEYTSTAFKEYMCSVGIDHQKTKANSSASNGVAEHGIRTLNDYQQCMCANSNLPDKYWGYAILHAAYLWNVTSKSFLNGRTPKEVFSGRTPDVAHLRVFGCTAWAQVPNKKRTKLHDWSMKCTYLGFAPNQKAHLLVHQETGKIYTSRGVVFDEGNGNHQRVVLENYEDEYLPEDVGNKDQDRPPKSEPSELKPEPSIDDMPSKPKAPKLTPLHHTTRTSKPPTCYGANVGDEAWLVHIDAMVEALNVALKAPPQTYAEAVSRMDSPMWIEAMSDELESTTKHGIGPNGEVIKYKAQIVAKGFSQHPGVNFGDTSLPVANSDSFRILMAMSASKDYKIIQLDIKTAFLHGPIDEEIYMEQPEGFGDGPEYVWKLQKALYGLKQAARAFYL